MPFVTQKQEFRAFRAQRSSVRLTRSVHRPSLAINGERYFSAIDFPSQSKQMGIAKQFSSNRSFLNFTGKAKIHAPKVTGRFSFSATATDTARNNNQPRSSIVGQYKASRMYPHSNFSKHAANYSQHRPGNSLALTASIDKGIWTKHRLQAGVSTTPAVTHRNHVHGTLSEGHLLSNQAYLTRSYGAQEGKKPANSFVASANEFICSQPIEQKPWPVKTILATSIRASTETMQHSAPNTITPCLQNPSKHVFDHSKIEKQQAIFSNSAPSASNGITSNATEEFGKPLSLQQFVREVPTAANPLSSSCETEEFGDLCKISKPDSALTNRTDSASQASSDEDGVSRNSCTSSIASSEAVGDDNVEDKDRERNTHTPSCLSKDNTNKNEPVFTKDESVAEVSEKKKKKKKTTKQKIKRVRSKATVATLIVRKPSMQAWNSGSSSGGKTLAKQKDLAEDIDNAIENITATKIKPQTRCSANDKPIEIPQTKQSRKKLDTGLEVLKSQGFEIKYHSSEQTQIAVAATVDKIKKKKELDTGLTKLKEQGFVIKIKSEEKESPPITTPRQSINVEEHRELAKRRVQERKKAELQSKQEHLANVEKAALYAREVFAKQKLIERNRIYALNAIHREWKMANMKAFEYAKKHGIEEEDADDNDADDNDADEDSGTEDAIDKDQIGDRCDEDAVHVEENISNTALKEDSMSKDALNTAATMASTRNKTDHIERGDMEGLVDAQ